MTEYKADQIIRHLEMQPHREGGWYRFMWRHEKMAAKSTLGDAYTGERALCSLIYYLLWGEEISRWHQLKSPEIWTWHCGDSPEQEQQIRIGNRLDQGDAFQFVVPGGIWQTTRLDTKRKHGFALVSCIVSPAFLEEDCYLPEPLF